jgi:cytochrome b involved in lipid metabolism
VEAYSQKTEKTLLVLDDYILDVTSFSSHHPGGGVMLRNNNLKNVD